MFWGSLTMSYAPKSSRKFIMKVHYLKFVQCRSLPILEEAYSYWLGIEMPDNNDLMSCSINQTYIYIYIYICIFKVCCTFACEETNIECLSRIAAKI